MAFVADSLPCVPSSARGRALSALRARQGRCRRGPQLERQETAPGVRAVLEGEVPWAASQHWGDAGAGRGQAWRRGRAGGSRGSARLRAEPFLLGSGRRPQGSRLWWLQWLPGRHRCGQAGTRVASGSEPLRGNGLLS